ncbi:hypothetical protein SS1G_07947 [Sclerotinia sclerotiorum 1980 UF-70]|uniref:Cytochrome P450 n=1 Tax=Sclerotinia sclerotiorum (strain ATCC 18683 / 1980 / Ss-1) TaxID=665079 RepID=A7ERJ3_SCLS1|nr:hypothetical protein SS1G_07947 [Sclerotinia sclerotiorum 1980 UF-70]EDN92085.1 hypothetical protein SS1G_07947 [Sclerotinia sclerotiorum 1980 UF-70]
MSLAIYLSIAMSLIVLLVFISPCRSRFPGIPRVGKTSGLLDFNRTTAKKEFVINGHRLVDEGYQKYKDEPFIVQTEDMERLILPPKFLAELPGFVPDMAAELSFAMSESLIHCSSRATGNALRPYPRLLRPVLRSFLAPKTRMDGIFSKALEILGSAIQERQKPEHKANNLLGFLVSTSEVVNPKEIVLKLLVLNSAALHTSTMFAVHTLYYLCERPSYILDLRAKMRDALKEEGSWRISTINKLRKLDSFMKESMRYNQPNALSFDRIVLTPHTLSTGLHLPIGTFISMASESMSRDPTYYSNHDSPATFNPSRFYQSPPQTEKTTYNPLKGFTSIEPGNLAWGNGRQTCPGRWYAGVVIKLVVGTLLEGYEMKFPEGVKRPGNFYRNAGIMPCTKQEILLRKLVLGDS